MLRISLVAAALITAWSASLGTAAAIHNAPWCSQGRIGSMTPDDCSFNTYEQCLAAVSGTSRSCTRNYSYQSQQKPRRKRQQQWDD